MPLTLQADSLPAEPQGKPKNILEWVSSFLQGIFLSQESTQGLLHCWWILYQLSYEDFPGSSAGKESACNAEEPGLTPGLRRSSGEGIATHSSYLA